jgi:hypothetical protein
MITKKQDMLEFDSGVRMRSGDVISYIEMCSFEGVNLQRGMNYRLHPDHSVILMSLRPNAPYADKVEENGKILIYEGHDTSRTTETPIPKNLDQPLKNHGGTLTQNGLFLEAARKAKNEQDEPETVRVYEKIRPGIWVFNGIFRLKDAWQERANSRSVFKFKLEIEDDQRSSKSNIQTRITLDHDRLIPSKVKLEVWKRDKGQCVQCGSKSNLHYDHVIPFSKGGTSLMAENIQLLCAKHNLAKRDKIE